MRVIFFFLAFGTICVYVPILIESVLSRDTIAQHEIRQGADPTTVLKSTGAGTPIIQKCVNTDLLYGESKDGYKFVRKHEDNLYAADIDGAIKYYVLDEAGKAVAVIDDNKHDLSSFLKYCISTNVKPVASDVVIKASN